YLEVELEISCNVFEKKELNIIEDLYSPKENLNCNQKNITVMKDKKTVTDICSIKEKMVIPEMQNARICNTEVIPTITKQNIYNDSIYYDGDLQVKFLFISATTNRIELKEQKIPFNANINCQEVLSNSNLNTSIDVVSQDFILNPDGNMDINIDLRINSDVSKMMEVSVIDDIETVQEDDQNVYSIVVYFVKPGDTLWNIAKKFKSTISAIASVNGIEDENKINVGQQLFIPKFV
ncbi:MAG: LysM peptidoglycan-binding domain-containing protein, partial [Clostridia bacterium]|nr:LysM peptidoglycan-binding domain-containing protein [Clostridia bacterium]